MWLYAITRAADDAPPIHIRGIYVVWVLTEAIETTENQ